MEPNFELAELLKNKKFTEVINTAGNVIIGDLNSLIKGGQLYVAYTDEDNYKMGPDRYKPSSLSDKIFFHVNGINSEFSIEETERYRDKFRVSVKFTPDRLTYQNLEFIDNTLINYLEYLSTNNSTTFDAVTLSLARFEIKDFLENRASEWEDFKAKAKNLGFLVNKKLNDDGGWTFQVSEEIALNNFLSNKDDDIVTSINNLTVVFKLIYRPNDTDNTWLTVINGLFSHQVKKNHLLDFCTYPNGDIKLNDVFENMCKGLRGLETFDHKPDNHTIQVFGKENNPRFDVNLYFNNERSIFYETEVITGSIYTTTVSDLLSCTFSTNEKYLTNFFQQEVEIGIKKDKIFVRLNTSKVLLELTVKGINIKSI